MSIYVYHLLFYDWFCAFVSSLMLCIIKKRHWVLGLMGLGFLSSGGSQVITGECTLCGLERLENQSWISFVLSFSRGSPSAGISSKMYSFLQKVCCHLILGAVNICTAILQLSSQSIEIKVKVLHIIQHMQAAKQHLKSICWGLSICFFLLGM